MENKTQFQIDLENKDNTFSMAGKQMNRALYNLIVSKRDLQLWTIGLKPHKGWKVTDVKLYFGLKGNNKANLVEQIKTLCDKHLK
jgi:hypothetical protein